MGMGIGDWGLDNQNVEFIKYISLKREEIPLIKKLSNIITVF